MIRWMKITKKTGNFDNHSDLKAMPGSSLYPARIPGKAP